MISSFRRDLDEINALLAYQAVYSGNFYGRFGKTSRFHFQSLTLEDGSDN
jgi:hypothetical protein